MVVNKCLDLLNKVVIDWFVNVGYWSDMGGLCFYRDSHEVYVLFVSEC